MTRLASGSFPFIHIGGWRAARRPEEVNVCPTLRSPGRIVVMMWLLIR